MKKSEGRSLIKEAESVGPVYIKDLEILTSPPPAPSCHTGTHSPFTLSLYSDGWGGFSLPSEIIDFGTGKFFTLKTTNSSEFQIRLDICLDGENEDAIPKQVILRERVFAKSGEEIYYYAVIKADKDAKYEGLNEAVFGDLSKLFVLIKNENGTAFHMKSWIWEQKQDKPIVSAVLGSVDERGQFAPRGMKALLGKYKEAILIGTFNFGNPFVIGCDGLIGTPKKQVVGTVTFEYAYCLKQGSGTMHQWTDQYSLQSFTLTDMAEELDPNQRTPVIIKGEDDIAKFVDIRVSHHNLNDSMSLKLPEATYNFRFPRGNKASLKIDYNKSGKTKEFNFAPSDNCLSRASLSCDWE